MLADRVPPEHFSDIVPLAIKQLCATTLRRRREPFGLAQTYTKRVAPAPVAGLFLEDQSDLAPTKPKTPN